ncbi:MAG: tRNA lysidine(34) synthetase TilS [Parvibaculaceae bacterium]|nr:tRNA lysidine(34) synthetase TilS [Parvibaculaceae bacterium]
MIRALTYDEFDGFLASLNCGRRLAVGVSGGADSLALALLLAQWQKKEVGREVHVLTVDHGLRAAAAQEAVQVGQWMQNLGLSHQTLVWEGEKPQGAIQAAARHARYDLMAQYCQQNDLHDLLVAHHGDDQAETFLMRLQRGSGVDGLAAMAPSSPLASRGGQVRLLRPLLSVPRDRLVRFMEEAGHRWIEDPSNADEQYLRVQVRQALKVLEGLGLGRDRLVTTAGHMARAREALEGDVSRFLTHSSVRHPWGAVRVALADLQALPDEIGLRVLARLFQAVAGNLYAPRFAKLEALWKDLRAGAVDAARTLGGVHLFPETDGFWLCRETSAVTETRRMGAAKDFEWDGRFDLYSEEIANDKGLEIRALGMVFMRALKETFSDELSALPRPLFHALACCPALFRQNELVGLPDGLVDRDECSLVINLLDSEYKVRSVPIWDRELDCIPFYSSS